MTRPRFNFIVDSILFVLMAGIIFIGILLGWAMDTGPQGTKVFWSLHRHQWGDIHLWLSLAFAAALVVHLVMHWKWISGSTRRILGRSWKLILLLAAPVLLVWGLAALQDDPVPYGRGWGQHKGLSDGQRRGYDRGQHGQSGRKGACSKGR